MPADAQLAAAWWLPLPPPVYAHAAQPQTCPQHALTLAYEMCAAVHGSFAPHLSGQVRAAECLQMMRSTKARAAVVLAPSAS